jgi:hypothetical protein
MLSRLTSGAVSAISVPLLATLVVGLAVPSQRGAAEQLGYATPSPNVNIVGTTPDINTANIPDFFRLQQHEPSCKQASDTPSNVFCGMNDCRAANWADVQNDCWIGVAQSRFFEVWTSRLMGGYNLDPYESLNMGFAADPSVAEVIGNPTGMMLLTFIASFRDSDRGLVGVKRFVESPLEDGEPYREIDEPARILATGSEGRFLDKVASLYIVGEDVPQTTSTETVKARGIGEDIEVVRVDGLHVVAYTVFTGSGKPAKVYVQSSTDGGRTYSSAVKVSEELNSVTGVHLAYLPDVGISLTYRVSRDSNEMDSVKQVFSPVNQLAKNWTKSQTLFEICPLDQQATGSTFRNFTFPWGADDGERLWVFSADKVDEAGRRIVAQGQCTQVEGAPPGTYPGVTKIVGMSSTDGKNWFGSTNNPDEPFILTGDSPGYHVLPFAEGAKGRVDVGFWSTEEEEGVRPPPAGGAELPLIYDYLGSDPGGASRVFRRASIYATRISGCKAAAGGACTPRLPTDQGLASPVRVSQYQTVDFGGVLQEVEANRLNLRTHGGGQLAYNGDYGSIATPSFRRLPPDELHPFGRVIKNSLPRQPEETDFTESLDVIYLWGENRDVFGAFVPNPADANARFLYSRPENAAPGLQAPGLQANSEDGEENPGRDAPDVTAAQDDVLVAVGEPDDNPGESGTADEVACSATTNFSSARDTNVYAALVEDAPSFFAATQGRPMNTVQRMFPAAISFPLEDADPATPEPDPADFCMVIANQPLDGGPGGPGRASFYPLPAFNAPSGPYFPPVTRLDVRVEPDSRAYRSVFVTSSDPETRITVNAYEGLCPEGGAGFGNFVGSIQVGSGQVFDPLFCRENPGDSACQDAPVDTSETHNIRLSGFQFQEDILEAPGLQALAFGAPGLQAEGYPAPGFQADSTAAPGLQAPGFQAEVYEANTLLAPGLQAPGLQASSLSDAMTDEDPETKVYYQDLTTIVTTNANVATTYSADIAVLGLNPDETEVQFFAWQPNIHTTTRVVNGRCEAVPEADNTVIAAVNLGSPGLQAAGLGANAFSGSNSLDEVTLPTAFSETVQDPYAGELSFLGKPGDLIALTVRLWVTGESKDTLDRLNACSTQDPAPEDCTPEEIEFGAFLLVPVGAAAHGCNTSDVNNGDPTFDCISAQAEKITPPDRFPPEFIPPDQGTATVEAETVDGTVISTPGTLPSVITVTDSDPNLSIACSSPMLTINQDETLFPLGDTLVNCSATDTSDNSASAGITIAVVDSFDPEISVPDDIVDVPATGPSGAAVNFTVTASDNIDPAPVIECTIPDGPDGTQVVVSGDTFPLGVNPVTCTATDRGGNTASKTFNVTVVDLGAPTISVPQVEITVEATGPSGAAATFDVTATDDVDPSVDIECKGGDGVAVASGQVFPLGTTSITCTATDDAGNSDAGAPFNVVVQDTTAPVFDNGLPDISGIGFGEPVTFDASASDLVDTDVEVVCTGEDGATVESGDTFPTGTTIVECTASDDGRFGDGTPPLNTVTDSFSVSVLLGATGVTPIQNPNNLKTGTSIPFTWAWTNEVGAFVAVGVANQMFEVWSGTCAARIAPIFRGDPGSSGLRDKSDNSYQFNFQAIDNAGTDLPASNRGEPYCAIVKRLEGGVVVQEQVGDFKLRR